MKTLYLRNKREILIYVLLISILFLISSTKNFYLTSIFNFILVLILCFYYVKALRKRLTALIFTFSVGMFLVFRPIIDILTNFQEHLAFHYRFKTAFYANVLVAISLLAIVLGQRIYEEFLLQRELEHKNTFPKALLRARIHRLAWPFYILSSLALFAGTLERILYRIENSYESLYAHFSSQLPFIVTGFASLSAVLMIIILITAPSKRWSYGAVGIYLFLTGLLMVAGVRANFMKTLLFLVFILLQRDLLKTKVSRKMFIRVLIIAFVSLFVLVGLFYMVNILRSDYQVKANFNVPLQFLYDQGISFMAIVRGPEVEAFPMFQHKHYTFGPFIDTFDGTKSLSAYSEEFLLEGNSLASDIAYYLYGENALKGYGLGSSYLIEVFLDFGYAGAIIYSVLLGILLGSLSQISWNHYFIDAFKLRLLMELFYIPRAPALQFVLNTIMPQFLVPLFGLLFLAFLWTRLKERRYL